MKYSHVSHKDRPNSWWLHKIIMDYKQKVCLQCRKKRLDLTMMSSLLLAMAGLEEAQHIVPPEACQWPWPWVREGERRGGWGGEAAHQPPYSHTPAHRLTSPHSSLLCFFIPLSSQTRPEKTSVPLLLSPPHFLVSLYYFPSQALSL